MFLFYVLVLEVYIGCDFDRFEGGREVCREGFRVREVGVEFGFFLEVLYFWSGEF